MRCAPLTAASFLGDTVGARAAADVNDEAAVDALTTLCFAETEALRKFSYRHSR